MAFYLRPPDSMAVPADSYHGKPWGSSPLGALPIKPAIANEWLFAEGRYLLNPEDHMRVARANMGASRPPLRTLNVMEGIRQLHKATLLKTRLDAVFASP